MTVDQLPSAGTPPRKRRQLYIDRGETSRFIDVYIEENGDLVVSGQDVGKAPLEWWGDEDYEFWGTLPAVAKDDLLLALIEEKFAGRPSAVDEFRTYVQSLGLPCRFETWT